jgi:cyclic pyranopterin phosphate synthase
MGHVHMVDIGAKAPSERSATARATVWLGKEARTVARSGSTKKGDIWATVRVAAICAAKRTSEWVPLCHPIALSSIEVLIAHERAEVYIDVTVRALDRTGVEMEALVGASAAALTLYDMLKSVDRDLRFETKLLEKRGGKSGTYVRTLDR